METMMTKMFSKICENNLVKKISIRIEKPEAKLPNDGGLAIVEAEWPFES
jgi:dihydroneopterin aldolase